MAPLKINVSDELRSRLKARAVKQGFHNVEEYVEAVLIADTAPEMDDEQIEKLLLARIDGRTVDMDDKDFERMRQKLQEWRESGRPESEP